MSEGVDHSLLHELMKAMHTRFDRVEARLDTLAADVRGMKEQDAAALQVMAGMMQSLAAQDHGLDGLRKRIERRLDLVDQS